jgi:hypothetical protein
MGKIKTHEEIIAGLKKELARTYRMDFERVQSSIMRQSRVSLIKQAVTKLDGALRWADGDIAEEKRLALKRARRGSGQQPKP